MTTERYLHLLTSNKLSNTKARRTLFDILEARHEPMSMRQLVNAASPTLDRSTVYRCVELFEKIGVVSKVYTGWKYRIELSELFSHHHHHLTCTNCGSVTSFEETAAFEEFLSSVSRKQSFSITSHSLELKGLCKDCRN